MIRLFERESQYLLILYHDLLFQNARSGFNLKLVNNPKLDNISVSNFYEYIYHKDKALQCNCHDENQLPECPAELVVVHVGLGLALAPAPGNLVRVGELELAISSLPRDAVCVVGVAEELEQELPKLDLTAARGELEEI
jgi:hypothetical protein